MQEIAERAAEKVDIPEGGGGVTSWNDLTDKPFGEIPPAFDITWDGNMDGHDTFSLEENTFFVKVSDEVFTKEQLLNSTMYGSDGYVFTFSEENIVVVDEAGLIDLSNIGVIFSAETFVGATGLPEGSVSNGVWFVNWTYENPCYVNRFVASSTIKTIDEKFLPDSVVLENELEGKGYQTEEQVTALINDARDETIEYITNQDVTILAEAQAYADSLASNYATIEQGEKADSAVQTINGIAPDKNGNIEITIGGGGGGGGVVSAITDEEIDEICSASINTYLESIAAEEVPF